jgi:hypothetical protein
MGLLVGVGSGGLGCGLRCGLRGDGHEGAFAAQEGDEVADLVIGQLVAERGHGELAVVDLGGDLSSAFASADELEVGADAAAYSGWAVAVDAAYGGEEFSATIFGVGGGADGSGQVCSNRDEGCGGDCCEVSVWSGSHD